MNEPFINHLNISDIFVSKSSNLHSIEYCYLFLTSDSFRQKRPEKQQKSISKLRTNIGSEIQRILQSDITSKNKALLLNYNPKLHERFLNPDHILYDDFIFVIETILRSHKFIVAENKSFFINDGGLNDKDNILIVNKVGDAFYPIFSENDTYIFNTSMDTINIISSFHINKHKSKNTYNERLPTNTTDDQQSTSLSFIVDKEDIVFEDFDDDLIIKYNNKNFLQQFSEDEKIIYIQNLLSIIPSEKASGKTFVSLFQTTTQVPNSVYNLDVTKVSNIDKRIDDYDEYIDNYALFKKGHPMTPFYLSVFFHENYNQQNNNLLLDHENVIRNSFTANINLLNNNDTSFDLEDCTSRQFTLQQLQVIAQKYKLTIKGSKQTMCQQLVNYNFLLSYVLDKIDDISVKDLKQIVLNANINLQENKTHKKEQLVQLLFKHNKLDYVKSILNMGDLREIVEEHNISISDNDDYDQIFDTLSNTNLLNLYFDTVVIDSSNCELEDQVTAIMAASDSHSIHINNHLEYFRPLSKDTNQFNGFYYNGDKSTQKFETFDVENYLNILHNIPGFLPIKCELHYFNGKTIKGTIQESLQNNDLLKIIIDNNKTVHYNLKNIHDNTFFLYTHLYEGYKYNKPDLNRNIFFIINNNAFEDMLKFVSLTLDQYLELFHPDNLNSLPQIDLTLQQFNTSFHELNFSDYDTLTRVINSTKITTSSAAAVPTTDISKDDNKKSIHDFLQFNNTNVSDLHKMFLLHSSPDYFKTIFDIYHPKYTTHTIDTLDTNISFNKNNNTKNEIVHQHQFNSFDDLQAHKQYVDSVIEKNIDIDLTIREKETNTYIQNLGTVLNDYKSLFVQFNNFVSKSHEQDYFEEKTYSTNSTKILEGTILNTTSFINSDPNNQYTSIETNTNPTNKNEDDVLHFFAQVIGITLTHAEKTLIYRQTKNIFNPFLTNFKKSKNPKSLKSNNDLSLWNHYANTIIYCAFFTLIVQFKYNLDYIMPKCKQNFSLHGFPLNNETDKTFTKYLACVTFSLFNKANIHYQSEEFIDSQITAVIKLIFKHNPSFRTIFDNLTHHKQEKPESLNTIINDIKPFFNHKDISSNIKSKINNKLEDNFKLHNINEFNINNLFSTQNHFDILCPTTKQILKKESFEFDPNTFISTLATGSIYEQDELTDDMNEELTLIMDEFEDLFKNYNTPFNFEQFKLNFLLQQNKSVKNFYYLINFNSFYSNLMNKSSFFNNNRSVFQNNTIPFSTNIHIITLAMFKSVKAVLQLIFNTNNIFTYLNTEMNNENRTAYTNFINAFKQFLQSILTRYDNQFVDVERLKQRAEILREEEKLMKMTKYDDVDNDMMLVLIELERTMGISIDMDTIQNNNENDENDEIDQRAEDDDIPE